MSTKLHGRIKLNMIPQHLLDVDQRGNTVIWIDVVEKRESPDQYGNTHTVTLYDKDGEPGRRTIFLGDLKPQEFGGEPAQPLAPGLSFLGGAPAPAQQLPGAPAPAGYPSAPVAAAGQPRPMGLLARAQQQAAQQMNFAPGDLDPARHPEDLPADFYK